MKIFMQLLFYVTVTNVAYGQSVILNGPSDLTPSGPVVATFSGQIIENLQITSNNGVAIRVEGHNDVIIRNVEILHSGGHGIYIKGGDRTLIENANIIHMGAPSSGPNISEINNIQCNNSSSVAVRNVRLRDGSTGIYTWDCPGTNVSFIEGYNFRGPFPRGQIVQFAYNSDNSVLEDFYNFSDLNVAWTEDNVNIWRSSNITIQRGLLDGNNSPSGVGIIFEHDDGASDTGYVENVDAIRMGNGAFSAANAREVTFQSVRVRDNICGDLFGRGNSLSNSLMFHSYLNTIDHNIRYQQAKYWNSCNGNVAWDVSTMQEADFTEENFQLRDPVLLTFSWEQVPNPPKNLTIYIAEPSRENPGT